MAFDSEKIENDIKNLQDMALNIARTDRKEGNATSRKQTDMKSELESVHYRESGDASLKVLGTMDHEPHYLP